MKKSKNYLALPAIVLAALYLTFLIDLHTLETSLQRVFIFCYFVVMGVLAFFLKSKYAEGKPFPLQSRIAAALLAALLVGAGWNTFLPHVRFPLEGSHMYALWEKLLYTLGAWCVVFYFAQLALLFLARPMEKRGWTERQKVLAFLLMGNFVFLFFTSGRIQPTHLTQGFLLLLTVLQPEERLYGKVPRKGLPCCHWDNRRLCLACELRAAVFSGRQHKDAFLSAGTLLRFERYSLVYPRYLAAAVRAGMALRPSPHCRSREAGRRRCAFFLLHCFSVRSLCSGPNGRADFRSTPFINTVRRWVSSR